MTPRRATRRSTTRDGDARGSSGSISGARTSCRPPTTTSCWRPSIPRSSSTCRSRPRSSPGSTTRCRWPRGCAVAASGNSPLLMGHRLWEETRVALFRQAVDTRRITMRSRGSRPRVFFGDKWVQALVLELCATTSRGFVSSCLWTTASRCPARCWTRGRPQAGARPAQRDDLPLEPTVLRRGERRAAPAHRESSHAARGPTAVDSIANAALFRAHEGTRRGVRGRRGPAGVHDCKANFYNGAATGCALRCTGSTAAPTPPTN